VKIHLAEGFTFILIFITILIGMLLDVGFQQIPVSFIIPNFLAVGTNGQQTVQGVNPGDGML
jgi:hypothetical protein